MKNIPKDAPRSWERVDELRQAIADALNNIEGRLDLFQFECKDNNWNDEIVFQIEEGCLKFGYALATLDNWWKDDK